MLLTFISVDIRYILSEYDSLCLSTPIIGRPTFFKLTDEQSLDLLKPLCFLTNGIP